MVKYNWVLVVMMLITTSDLAFKRHLLGMQFSLLLSSYLDEIRNCAIFGNCCGLAVHSSNISGNRRSFSHRIQAAVLFASLCSPYLRVDSPNMGASQLHKGKLRQKVLWRKNNIKSTFFGFYLLGNNTSQYADNYAESLCKYLCLSSSRHNCFYH